MVVNVGFCPRGSNALTGIIDPPLILTNICSIGISKVTVSPKLLLFSPFSKYHNPLGKYADTVVVF